MLFNKTEISELSYYQKKIAITFQKLLLKININETDDLIEKEMKKSYIKGYLRNSENCKDILKKVTSFIINNNILDDKFIYITKPYPMIHMANDELESGGFHNDQVGTDQMFTCWIPITKYNYPALSISLIKNKYLNFLNRFLKKLNLLNFFSKKLSTDYGSAYFWDAKIFHNGNKNTTNNISCAFQVKITSKPYLLEHSFNFKKGIENYDVVNEKEIINGYDIYSKFLELILSSKIKCLNDVDNFYNINNIKKNEQISFALSVLSQRLNFAISKNIEIKFSKNKIFLIDYMSALVGAYNLISLKRLFFSLSKNKEHKNYIKFNNFLNNLQLSSEKLDYIKDL
jgi:hypothetical protein